MKSKPIIFPRDHSAHDAVVEWWYYNGYLKDKDGNQYSFMDCLFRVDPERVKIPHLSKLPFKAKGSHVYFAHSIVSDIGAGKSFKDVQAISLASSDSFKKERLFVNYIDPIMVHGFVNNEMAEVAPDTFHIKTKDLDLVLESRKPALLEGGEGYISVRDRESYYYSLTDMKTSGTLIVDGKSVAVEGASWMDHQWADVSYRQDKWTWFSLQLEGGTDIMCCEYDDGKAKENLVDVLKGSNEQLHSRNMTLRRGAESWKSETTKAEYPLSWDIELPDIDAKLKVTAMVKDQEMIFMAINYWEGPIEVTGTIGGVETRGVGYMELVGYESDYNYLLTEGKGISRKLGAFIKSKIRPSKK